MACNLPTLSSNWPYLAILTVLRIWDSKKIRYPHVEKSKQRRTSKKRATTISLWRHGELIQDGRSRRRWKEAQTSLDSVKVRVQDSTVRARLSDWQPSPTLAGRRVNYTKWQNFSKVSPVWRQRKTEIPKTEWKERSKNRGSRGFGSARVDHRQNSAEGPRTSVAMSPWNRQGRWVMNK